MPTIESMTLDAIVAAIAAASYPPEYPVLSANLTASGQSLSVYVGDVSNVVLTLKNTGSATMSAGTFVFEGSINSTDGIDGDWVTMQGARSDDNLIATGRPSSALSVGATDGRAFEVSVAGYAWFRVRCSSNPTASSIATWSCARTTLATDPAVSVGSHQVTVSGTVYTAPGTTGEYSYISGASTNALMIGSGTRQLFEISIFNPTAAIVYVKLYNKATIPTAGTDVPRITIPVPVNGLVSLDFGVMGKRFGLGLGMCITAGPLSTDAVAVAAGVQVSATY